MKKNSNSERRLHRKIWLLKQRKKLARSRIKRRNSYLKRIHQKIAKLGINSKNLKNFVYDSKKQKITNIILPENLNFNENYEETVSTFTLIRNCIEQGTKISRIDFSRIKNITTAAALVLASLIDQWKERVRGKIKADLPSWDDSLIKLMNQMGVFELLSLEKPRVESYSCTTTYVPFMKGQVGERNAGKYAVDLRKMLEDITGTQINRHFLYEGLSEAITNTCHHAYKSVTDSKRKYWWLTGSYDRNTSTLQVTFYDRGVGIPKTLPTHRNFERIKNFFGIWKDSDKIQAAMEIGRSSTGMVERGKGLQNLIEFAKSYPLGTLRITSLRGTYREDYKSVDESPEVCKVSKANHDSSIGGTLIQWSVTI